MLFLLSIDRLIMERPLSLDYSQQVSAEYFADKLVQRADIFGSYARGDATTESNLDVLLSRMPNCRMTLFDLGHCKDDLGEVPWVLRLIWARVFRSMRGRTSPRT